MPRSAALIERRSSRSDTVHIEPATLSRAFTLVIACVLTMSASSFAAPPSSTKLYAGATLDEWRDRIKNFDHQSGDAANAVGGLLEIVQDRTAPAFTRRQAALALGLIGKPASRAVPVIVGLLDETGDAAEPTVVWAAKSLAQFGPIASDAAPALVKLLNNDKRPYHDRVIALEPLAVIGVAHPIVVPALIQTVEQTKPGPNLSADDANSLRALTADTIGLIGPAAAPAAPALVRALLDKNEQVRQMSAQALGALGGHSAIGVPALIEVMMFDEATSVRDAAEQALSKIGPEAVAGLTQLLDVDSPNLRMRAARCLGRMGSTARAAVPNLLKEVRDEDPTVRVAVVEALWQITSQPARVIPPTIELLQCDDRQVRIRAFRLLDRMGPKAASAVESLEQLRDHKNPAVRLAAEKALERIAARK